MCLAGWAVDRAEAGFLALLTPWPSPFVWGTDCTVGPGFWTRPWIWSARIKPPAGGPEAQGEEVKGKAESSAWLGSSPGRLRPRREEAVPKMKACPHHPAHCPHHDIHLGAQNRVQGIQSPLWGLESSGYMKGNTPGTECQPPRAEGISSGGLTIGISGVSWPAVDDSHLHPALHSRTPACLTLRLPPDSEAPGSPPSPLTTPTSQFTEHFHTQQHPI